jgi:GT2 family glycosyltransferase
MNDAPLVSVIIPVHNRATVLSDTLTSVRQQTYQNFEIIVVDDGSSDGSHAMAQKFADEDRRIKVLRQPNGGVSVARNTAIAHASGELIAFLDADDVWLPGKLAAHLDLLKREPNANLLFSDYFLWDGRDNLGRRYSAPHKFPDGDMSRRLIFFNLFGMSTVMIKRETLDAVGLFDVEMLMAEDWDLWLRIAERGLCARGVRQPLARYRFWADNASRNTIQMCESNIRVLEKSLARPQRAAWRRDCERSLQIARGNLALARVSPLIETQPGTVPAATLRAWLHCPTRFKWLLWCFGTLWPNSPWARIVYRKIDRKSAAPNQRPSRLTFCRRLGATALFRVKQLARPAPKAPVTFCIAHFNSPEFLDATLHAVRRFHPDARVMVADASSVWREFLAAGKVCARHGAELHPLAGKHRHTGLLNYMFRQIRSRVAIFLDQDCVLLASLDPLVRLVESGKVLVGPRDEFHATHPNFCGRYPQASGHSFRHRPEFVHASLMVMDAPRIRAWSAKPFIWRAEWGKHPLERYYGMTELVRRNQPDGVLTLDSEHTGYGLGQVYLFEGSRIAYHQWYSGQVYGQAGKMDAMCDADWLRDEMKRFLRDYWDGRVDFKLPATTAGLFK